MKYPTNSASSGLMVRGAVVVQSPVQYISPKGGRVTWRGSPTSWFICMGTRSPAARSPKRFQAQSPVWRSTTLMRWVGVPWMQYPRSVSTVTTGSAPFT